MTYEPDSRPFAGPPARAGAWWKLFPEAGPGLVGLSGCYSNLLGEFQGLVADFQCEAQGMVQFNNLSRTEYPDR